ncbi:hypothetical protein [Streptomyces sp. NPDC048606]|uniref:hypothetical protein n=1 Tax=Streptomyces sp. NPDC048606 TaxID=3154726 RepID=UPI00343287E7
METYLNLMLIRFGLVVGALVVAALLLFAVALTLRRRGELDRVRRYADPVMRAALRALARRIEGRSGGTPWPRRRDGLR